MRVCVGFSLLHCSSASTVIYMIKKLLPHQFCKIVYVKCSHGQKFFENIGKFHIKKKNVKGHSQIHSTYFKYTQNSLYFIRIVFCVLFMDSRVKKQEIHFRLTNLFLHLFTKASRLKPFFKEFTSLQSYANSSTRAMASPAVILTWDLRIVKFQACDWSIKRLRRPETNQRPVLRSRDLYGPMRGQFPFSGHVICISVWTNHRIFLPQHLRSSEDQRASQWLDLRSQ